MARIDIVMPQLGESIAEGTISKWLKAVGDTIAEDEPLLEVSTDKVDAEIPSVAAGRLAEILHGEGETVEIQTVIARIETDAAADLGASEATPAPPAPTEEPAPAAATPAPASAPVAPAAAAPVPAPVAVAPAAPATSGDGLIDRRRTVSSPLVRNIAKEHGVQIAAVHGTGVDGRVTKADILAYIERGDHLRVAAPTAATAAAPAPAAPAPIPGALVSEAMALPGIPTAIQTPDIAVRPGDRVEKMNPMRASIAEHMARSKQLSAHVQTCWEVDMSAVMNLRKTHKASLAAEGVKLSVTACILRAATVALRQHPIVNASVSGDQIIYRGEVNLGCAVAVDGGLMVPVIKNADRLTVRGIASELEDLATRARTKRLTMDDLTGGTFAVTNPGVFGSLWGTPVINQPNVAILGCGRTEERVCVVDGMIAIKPKAYYVLSFDHRLVNGSDADMFMKTFKEVLENMDASSL
ncbi:MAG: dihydrolipoyllysine succinyltransferase [Myxococcales bacterium]|nr:dihydrolipoyllysine succinyltransferase [Myxococcales bacterium]